VIETTLHCDTSTPVGACFWHTFRDPTSRLHARGAIGLEELTTTQYVAWGDEQIRG